MNGPGENFRYPLPDSTNYLSAYGKRGNLLRERNQDQKQQSEPPKEDSMTPDEQALNAAADETAEKELKQKLPGEALEDLRPFPLNRSFISQSILSEELRSEIWDRVQQQGKSIRQVSQEMGVDMLRVAAVVRLVEVERRMVAEVSSKSSFPSLSPTRLP